MSTTIGQQTAVPHEPHLATKALGKSAKSVDFFFYLYPDGIASAFLEAADYSCTPCAAECSNGWLVKTSLPPLDARRFNWLWPTRLSKRESWFG